MTGYNKAIPRWEGDSFVARTPPRNGMGREKLQPQHLPGDDQVLDLVRSLADRAQSLVAVHPFHGVVARVPVSAVYLDGLVAHALGGFRDEQLGHGGLLGEALPLRLEPCRPVD